MDTSKRLRELYEEQAGSHMDPYVRLHFASDAAIKRQIYSVLMYQKFISGSVLDWGCRHAPDASILRMLCGNEIDIHGCDVCKVDSYRVFHDFSNIKYTTLTHPYVLPYQDNSFDSVISSGVLEHVPNDYESIKEVYRILKPNGYFIITFLPNRFSYTEKTMQLMGKGNHSRRYILKQTKELLLHSGFQTIESRYFLMVPTMLTSFSKGKRLTDVLWPLNGFLEKLWPFNRLSSNLFIVCAKRSSMP